jgi:hypothetical protein
MIISIKIYPPAHCVKKLENLDEEKATIEGPGKKEEDENEDYVLVNLDVEDRQEAQGS